MSLAQWVEKVMIFLGELWCLHLEGDVTLPMSFNDWVLGDLNLWLPNRCLVVPSTIGCYRDNDIAIWYDKPLAMGFTRILLGCLWMLSCRLSKDVFATHASLHVDAWDCQFWDCFEVGFPTMNSITIHRSLAGLQMIARRTIPHQYSCRTTLQRNLLFAGAPKK